MFHLKGKTMGQTIAPIIDSDHSIAVVIRSSRPYPAFAAAINKLPEALLDWNPDVFAHA